LEWKGKGEAELAVAHAYRWSDLLLLYEGDVNAALEPTLAAINSIKFRKVLYNRGPVINRL